ncbi:MAG: PaaI family thioesterase [Deltaproteobacteria bacterium]|nr:PaaI family thioesterase [Deltaproteobacteria bacterium]
MDKKVKDALFNKTSTEPFARKMGMELVDVSEGYARVEMNADQSMSNIFDMVHGGAIFSLMDEAFEVASNSHGSTAFALNMSVTYVAPPSVGSRLTAVAREINLTRKTANYEIKVFDGQGKLIAFSNALVYRKGDPLPFVD